MSENNKQDQAATVAESPRHTLFTSGPTKPTRTWAVSGATIAGGRLDPRLRRRLGNEAGEGFGVHAAQCFLFSW